MNTIEKLVLKTKMNASERRAYKENYDIEASRCAEILAILDARKKYSFELIEQPKKDFEVREYYNRNGAYVKVSKPL